MRLTHASALLGLALIYTQPTTLQAAEVELSPEDDIVSLMSSLGPGDVFIFGDGVYQLDAGITWSGIGTESDPIIIKAKEGAKPVLETAGGGYVAYINNSEYIQVSGLTFSGNELWDQGDANYRGLRIDNSHGITVQNIEIKHTAYTGLMVSGDSSDITIKRCHIHDTINGDGIYMGCGNGSCAITGALIENNWIHGLGGNGSQGIELAQATHTVEILDNIIYQTEGGGIATYGINFGENNLIERNAIWSIVGSGLSINGGALVRNNIVFNIQGHGIYSRPSDDESTGAVIFSHNTITDTTLSAAYLWSWSGHEAYTFTNNALTNVTGIALETDTEGSGFIAGNIITGYVTGISEGFVGGAGLDDYFNAENWDFWPTEGSHLVDAGNASAAAYVPADDFNGLARSGAAPDAGAFERTDATNPGWQLQEGFKEEPSDTGAPNAEDISGGCGCAQPEEDDASALLFLPLIFFARRRR